MAGTPSSSASVPDPRALCRVEIEPVGKRVLVPPGTNLLEAVRLAGVELVASCGGVGICGTCQVRLIRGSLSPISPVEQECLPDDPDPQLRLACQAEVQGDVTLDLPSRSMLQGQVMQHEGPSPAGEVDPLVRWHDLALFPPGPMDARGDLTRVNDTLLEAGCARLQAAPAGVGQLSDFLRRNDWQARIVFQPGQKNAQLVSVLPRGSGVFGLALDMGSTKVALYLVDLERDATVQAFALMNPQIAYGEDIISRIAFANRGPAERTRLQQVLVEGINQAVQERCLELGIGTEQIVDVVAVGNTAIHHLLCGLPVEPLGRAPFAPLVQDALSFPAGQVGLAAAPGASLYLPPNIAGFVGADHVAALTASREYLHETPSLLVDIGTNTEISLVTGDRILSCSAASGPAFEGAHLREGMRAAPGAIDRAVFTAGSPVVSTIGGIPPIGICGSGILNILAGMLEAGLLDQRGRFTAGQGAPYRLVDAAHSGLGREIVLTRGDVHEIQLAKAAIRSGIETLLARAGVRGDQLAAFVAAGAFGTYLDPGSAVRVGMFPDLPLERFHQVGNAAGAGAREMLVSRHKRAEAEALSSRVEYLELTTAPEFTPLYTQALFFPAA